MEAELLKGMIEDRDQCIDMIRRKSGEQQEKERRLREELSEVQETSAAERIEHQTAKTRLLHDREQAEERLEGVQRSLQEQGNSIKGYVSTAGQKEQQRLDDSSYVMRMQAQLCKAMHSMGIMDHQVELMKKHLDVIVKIQKEALSTMTEEKCQMELELMNSLIKSDSERREAEAELKGKADEIQNDIDQVERQISENRESDEEESDEEDGSEEGEDEDEDDEEEDEEEKQMKEELMQLLRDKTAQIEKLEKENELQLETIEELEAEIEQHVDARPNSPPRELINVSNEQDEIATGTSADPDPEPAVDGDDGGDAKEDGEKSDGNGSTQDDDDEAEQNQPPPSKDVGDPSNDGDDEDVGEDKKVEHDGFVEEPVG